MKVLGVIVLLLAVLGTARAVANGTVQEPYSSPWQAKLYLATGITNIWPCGGTLISEYTVLTAARCFTFQKNSKAQNLYVYLGVWDLESTTEKHRLFISGLTVKNVVIHEGYNATTHENDIALIRLPSKVNFTDYIQPAKLATQRNVTLGDVARISGWQYPVREWDLNHQYPHGGDVTVIDNSLCQETYPNYVIDDETICAAGTVAFCYGDEGIALPLHGGTVVAGMAYGAKDVLTPAEECPILPQTYLSLSKYLDWIKANSDYQDS